MALKGAFGIIDAGSAALGLIVVPFFVYYLLLDMRHLRALTESHTPRATGRPDAAFWMRSARWFEVTSADDS